MEIFDNENIVKTAIAARKKPKSLIKRKLVLEEKSLATCKEFAKHFLT